MSIISLPSVFFSSLKRKEHFVHGVLRWTTKSFANTNVTWAPARLEKSIFNFDNCHFING